MRWLLASLLLARCASHSLEVGRPLVVAAIPTDTVRLAELHSRFPGTDVRALTESMEYSQAARNVFDIHKHNEWTSFAPIGRLVKAINLVPDNPFAWVQLGSYLALNHQTQAAILATRRGIDLADGKCAIYGCTDDLEKLRHTAVINLATYATDAERPLEGLLEMERMAWWDLPPFEQLAYHWTAVSVRVAVGDLRGARRELQEASVIPESDLSDPPSNRTTYPQYFGTQRKAIELYLDATIDHAAQDLSCAEEKLLEAVRYDPQLWDAHLLLANIHYALRDYDECIARLMRTMAAKQSSHDMFRPERLSYNLGNAYLARYEDGQNPADLERAREAFVQASKTVERRFKKEQERAELAGIFDEPEAGRFFLDALSTTSPIYADACNNLGRVFERWARAATDPRVRDNWVLEAEGQWRLALRDAYWPRRHLAYGNLARLYAHAGRLSAAAEAADAALEADPFNITPLRALLDLLGQKPGSEQAVLAAQMAARLIAQRRWLYPLGTFEGFLEPYYDRLGELPRSDGVRRALILLDYALADDDEADAIVRRAHDEFPTWIWPAIETARNDMKNGGQTAQAEALIEPLFKDEIDIPSQDWLVRRELGDAYLLRAELLLGSGEYLEARENIEQAMAAGVSMSNLNALRTRIQPLLTLYMDPLTSSLAVLPFDPIYVREKTPIGHSLAYSFSSLLRSTGTVTVRHFERDALDLVDWNAQSPVDAGRSSGIGAVLAGRYARSRDRIYIDARVFDSVSGAQLFANSYATPPAGLLEKQAEIVTDVLAALRFAPRTPDLAALGFSRKAKAYENYLIAMNILLSQSQGDARELQRARSLLQEAIAEDGQFARAYAGLTFALYSLANLHAAPSEVLPEAARAAEQAAKLAPLAADAQLAIALTRTWYDWDLEAGETAFNSALELDPANSTIRRLYGDYLAAQGCFAAALMEKREALKFAPQSAIATLEVGKILFYQREYDQALAQADAALTLQPTMARAYELKAWVHTARGHYDDALHALDAAAIRSKKPTPLQLSHRGVTLALKGDRVQADIILGQLRDYAAEKETYVLPLLEARVLAAKGDIRNAIVKLKEAYRDKSESMVWLSVDPWLTPLKEDSSFQQLIENVHASGLPRYKASCSSETTPSP